jgi:F-type H+-transporting ATPase subunit delta
VKLSGEALVIANRYAKALFQVVLEKKEDSERIDRELRDVSALLEAHPDLDRALGSPAILSSKRVAIVEQLFGKKKLSRTTMNLLGVMTAKERMPILPLVRAAYRQQVDEHEKVEKADVVTSYDLSKKEEKALIARLSEITGKTVRADFRTDPELVGGLIIKIGNLIYDSSVTTQLARFKERLLSTY